MRIACISYRGCAWDPVDRDATAELEVSAYVADMGWAPQTSCPYRLCGVKGEKLEGDQALNKLFKDIYGRADEVLACLLLGQ